MKTSTSAFWEVRKSLGLALPLLLSEWLYALNFFVVTWISSRLGREALAAISLATTIYFFLMMMISGVSAATAILAAQELGAGCVDRVKHVFAQSILLNALLICVAGVILWNAHYLLQALNMEDKHVMELVKSTLHAYMWSLCPLAFLIMVEKFLIGLHRTRLVLFITLITIPISMVANYSFVLGKLGLPRCGLPGFGYGQAVAYSVLGILFVVLTFLVPSLRSLRLFSAFKHLSEGAKFFFEIWRVGWPLGAMFSIEMGAVLTFTLMMSLFGTDALAAYQLSRQYLTFAFTTLFALTESAAVRVGHAVGENDRARVKQCFYVNIGIAITFMAILSCVYLLAKDSLLAVDIDISAPQNAHLVLLAKHFLTAIAVLVIVDGVRNTAAGGLRGLKDTKSNMYSSIIGYWLAGLPLAYSLGRVFGLGGEGLWMGFILGIALSAVILLIRFYRWFPKLVLSDILIR